MSYVETGLGAAPFSSLLHLQLPTRQAPPSTNVFSNVLAQMRNRGTRPRPAPPIRLTPPLNIMPPGGSLPVTPVVAAPSVPADPITMTSSMDMVPLSATVPVVDNPPGVVDEAEPGPATDAPAPAATPALSPVVIVGGLALLLFLSRRS